MEIACWVRLRSACINLPFMLFIAKTSISTENKHHSHFRNFRDLEIGWSITTLLENACLC